MHQLGQPYPLSPHVSIVSIFFQKFLTSFSRCYSLSDKLFFHPYQLFNPDHCLECFSTQYTHDPTLKTHVYTYREAVFQRNSALFVYYMSQFRIVCLSRKALRPPLHNYLPPCTKTRYISHVQELIDITRDCRSNRGS